MAEAGRARRGAVAGLIGAGMVATLVLAHVAALFAESAEDARFALSPDGPTRARMALFATLALILAVALGALRGRLPLADRTWRVLHAYLAAVGDRARDRPRGAHRRRARRPRHGSPARARRRRARRHPPRAPGAYARRLALSVDHRHVVPAGRGGVARAASTAPGEEARLPAGSQPQAERSSAVNVTRRHRASG